MNKVFILKTNSHLSVKYLELERMFTFNTQNVALPVLLATCN